MNDDIGAPYIPIFGLLIKIKFNTILTTLPHNKAIAGVYILPRPNNEPCNVWFTATNIIVTAAICNTNAPSDAFGYNNFNIGSANAINPTAHGIIINIEVVIELDIFLAASSNFFLERTSLFSLKKLFVKLLY